MPRNLILLSIDGLASHALGPYGNTWIPTPAFDELAARSLLLENHIVDHESPAKVFGSWWGNQHAAAQQVPFSWERFIDAEHEFRLVTDKQPDSFGEMLPPREYCEFVTSGDEHGTVAEIEDSAMGRLFVESLESLSQSGSPLIYWIHSRGLTGPWDAPYEFRQSFVADDDPDPPDFTSPPIATLDAATDPDVLTGISHAYAAQVMLLDACLDALIAELRRTPLEGETLLLLTSPRGYPLGNHGIVGFANAPLRSEWLHTPLIVSRLDASDPSIRERGFVQPPDVSATISNWLGSALHPAGSNSWGRSLLPLLEQAVPLGDASAFTAAKGKWSLQTPMWRLCQHEDADLDIEPQLFAKPDDYWEINNVAALCIREIDDLVDQANRFQQAVDANDRELLAATEDSKPTSGESEVARNPL